MALNRRTWIGIAAAAAAMWLLFFFRARSESGVKAVSSPAPISAARDEAPLQVSVTSGQALKAVAATPEPAASPAEAPSHEARSALPPLGTHAKNRQWVYSTFGNQPEQLGRKRIEGETYPPQGFAVTPDGDLLVLDNAKHRLVRYGQDGKIEQVTDLPAEMLVMPSDVAVAADGTIAVIDHPGLHTNGTVLFDAEGKKKVELPQLADTLSGLYAAGNDLYVDTDGLSSVKLGNTQGIPDAETPAVHQEEDGRIAGRVAPDGKTVLSFHMDDAASGDFSVSATRGTPAEEVFTHFYRYPDVSGIPFLQADGAGRIYMVIHWLAQLALVCLDGTNGNPVGAVELPLTTGGGGTQRRMFNVAPGGGLVYAVIRESDVRYELFNCHP
jgi:sugar lactone lactonase YvrE